MPWLRCCSTAWPASGWWPAPDGWSSCGCDTANGPGATPAPTELCHPRTMQADRSGVPAASARQPTPEIKLPSGPSRKQDPAMAADVETTTHMPARLGAHELVLLHGQPGSAADWLQVAGRLPAQFHAVAVDRPGYGSSRRPAGGFAANARAVLDDLDARGIRRAVLVGHSYGGGVALSAASLAPHRVEAVVLLGSVGPGCVNLWGQAARRTGRGAVVRAGGVAADAMDRAGPARLYRQAARAARCAQTSTSTGKSG